MGFHDVSFRKEEETDALLLNSRHTVLSLCALTDLHEPVAHLIQTSEYGNLVDALGHPLVSPALAVQLEVAKRLIESIPRYLT